MRISDWSSDVCSSDLHHDRDALVGLIRIYSDYPQRDTGHRVATLVARAEQIGAPDMQGAVIGWYRGTRHDQGHAEKLLTLCGRWVKDRKSTRLNSSH